ncbi:hypothetical protein GMORB2_5523, partial [Geosmithia morbida]
TINNAFIPPRKRTCSLASFVIVTPDTICHGQAIHTAGPTMSQRRGERPDQARGTQTTTEHQNEDQPGQQQQQQQQQQQSRVLRLRGARPSNDHSVRWAEDVVDNEGLGRKSSKADNMCDRTETVCCIYHRPKPVDESSDESSSSSDDDSSSGDDHHQEPHHHGKGKGKGNDDACGGHSHGKKKPPKQNRAPSPNAYEKVPKPKPKEPTGGVGK